MSFNLTRNLCFFDIEATGLHVIRDRIVQIAIIKYFKDGREPEELEMMINPGIPISEEAMNVHGITPKDLRNKPTFQQVAQKLFDFIGDSDMAGYNSNRFDLPLLMEEFARVGMEFDTSRRRTLDVQRIFYKMEPRTLRAALRFYTGKNLVDAHDAMADVRATIDVFRGQIEKYEGAKVVNDEGEEIDSPIVNDMQVIHEFTNDLKTIDATQRLKYNSEGEVVFNFGKYQDQSVIKVISKDRNYYNWILNKEFSSQVKQIVKKLMKDYEQEQRG